MKHIRYIILAALLASGGCGSDDSVSPSPDLATLWVGQYSGAGSYRLSNGVSGADQPVTLVIEAINPKQITVAVSLVYGTGRNDIARAFALLTPDNPDRITLESRNTDSRTVYDFNKTDGAISGTIVTSTVRIGGNWTQDQSLAIEVARE
ncbi:MAG: hypothetical protein GKR89_16485 [Candidatus Latescibacteria bacterium]|nr:hypothetical protein [Candidatus Latescibacterota bacterium]